MHWCEHPEEGLIMSENVVFLLNVKGNSLMTEFGDLVIHKESGDLVHRWVSYEKEEPEITEEVLESKQHFVLPLTVTRGYKEINGIDVEWYNIKDKQGKTIFRGALV